MNRDRVLQMAAELQQEIQDQPIELIAAMAEALSLIDTDEIKRAIPVYNARMFHLGRPLSADYIRALGLMLDAAKVLAEAGATANTRWRDMLADWPKPN